MAHETDRPIQRRPHTPKDPVSPSRLPPLPYHPNLKRELQSVTAALVLTYLEIHHPAPRDPNDAILNTPVTLDLDAVATDLGVSRRTLCVSLSVLCAWWPEEEARSRGARAGREFLNPNHTRYGRIKPYSATGSKTWRPGTIIRLRRNFGQLKHLLQKAGIATLSVPVASIAIPVPTWAEYAISAPTGHNPAQKESLVQILQRLGAFEVAPRKTRSLLLGRL
jgi:hypothetical protein